MRYVILLRGVNVGGVTVKMADLRELLTGLDYDDVKTVLASGNALVTCDASADEVKQQVEAALKQRFGYDAIVHVLTSEALRAAVDAYPFERGRDGWHDYALFVSDPKVQASLLELPLDTAHEQAAGGDGVVYWTVPKGDTLDSELGKAIGKVAYRPYVTSRNLNTLERMLG